MNIASVSTGLVAELAEEAKFRQAFIICSNASRSSVRRAFTKFSQFLISSSRAILYDGIVLPIELISKEIVQGNASVVRLADLKSTDGMLLKDKMQGVSGICYSKNDVRPSDEGILKEK